jgi:hypothetical protein
MKNIFLIILVFLLIISINIGYYTENSKIYFYNEILPYKNTIQLEETLIKDTILEIDSYYIHFNNENCIITRKPTIEEFNYFIDLTYK